MTGRDVLADIRERDKVAREYARRQGRNLSIAQMDRRDLIRELDRLSREITRMRAKEIDDQGCTCTPTSTPCPWHAREIVRDIARGTTRR